MALLDLVQTLTTPHPVDRYLELVRPMLTVRDMRARIVGVDRSVPGTLSLSLRPTRQWDGLLAGQFVQLGVVIDGVRHVRCYSPVNSQHDPHRRLDLTIRVHPHGLVSRYLHDHAEPGMILDLEPASGIFHLPRRRPERMLLISGGSGITPVLSMLRTLADEGYTGPVVFLHYARSPELVPHRDELTEIAAAHPNISVEMRYPERDGRGFDYDELTRVAPWFADADTFLCGPPPLMDSVREIFAAEGLSERLHTEEFVAPAVPVETADVHGTTTFSASGVAAENAGASLLEQAESAGLTPEFGCRMGICFSCTSVRRSGCTRNLRTGELETDPDQPIQLCVQAAVGDVDIEI
ncbi:FAD-binding oxidoreductase [Nocardia sp. NPDC019395]|uniref:ferredoxin reductase n=1 Tax=Nocardia sp. NPDC019395 TaxID=3154686 RepID=UPI0033F1E7AA